MASLCKAEVLNELFGSDSLSTIECWDLVDKHYARPLPFEPRGMSLPYKAEGAFSPPLPTPRDIANARNTPISRRPSWVYKVFDTYAVKFSAADTILQEAENLLYLEKHSKVRTPKVYAVFTHQGEDPLGCYTDGQTRPAIHYLVMEYIPGTTLSSELWSRYSEDVQRIICTKIADQLKKLREVKLGTVYYGRVHKQGWDAGFGLFSCPGKDACGPYESYEEFVDAAFDCARFKAATCANQKEFSVQAKLGLAYFKSSFRAVTEEDKQPTLSHLDLKFGNIIVQPTEEGDYNVTIIDWECLGWLPAWVEAVTILTRPDPLTKIECDRLLWEVLQGFQPFNLALARFVAEYGGPLGYFLQ